MATNTGNERELNTYFCPVPTPVLTFEKQEKQKDFLQAHIDDNNQHIPDLTSF